ncbi:MOLPALP family lipoprotein [[Acholeplasma] multilocale]|uniref:MOLPALP family lipoprotein n=1 Tax=[Acholeplasma] multilocale TaxID=264638 RepID=UPI00047B9A9C|nr:MOLPALP family lipoprotein [[Acholeplasma] multilocale]
MKKMLALLGAVALTASSAATVVACSNETSQETDQREFNNSQNNLQGSAAALAKQMIIADQNGFSLNSINNTLSGKSAQSVLEQMGMTFESNDRGLEEGAILEDLTNRYFGSGIDLEEVNVNGINLDGKLGNGKGSISQILPDDVLGMSGDELSQMLSMIMTIIPTISTGMLNTLLGALGSIIDLPELKDIAGIPTEIISLALELMLKNDKVLEKLEKIITEMDILEYAADVSIKNIDSALTIALTNGITMIMNPDYEPLDYATNDDIETNAMASLGGILSGILNGGDEASNSEVNSVIENFSLVDDIDYYSAILAQFMRAITLFQFKLSLFDDSKEVYKEGETPKTRENLFSKDLKNTDYISKVFKVEDDSATIGTEFSSGNINFKYLLSSIKYYLGNISDSEKADPKGYGLQKFINILIPLTVKPKNIGDLKTMDFHTSGIMNAIGGLLYSVIDSGGETVINLIYGLLPDAAKSLISEANFKKTITGDNLLTLIGSFVYALGNGGEAPTLKPFAKSITGLGFVLDLAWGTMPKLIKNTFESIYSGDFKKESYIGISALGLGIDLYETIIGLIPNGKEKVDEIFGDKPLNLITLANTPLDKFIGSKPSIASYYTSLSITELINDISKDFDIDENATYAKLENYSIRFTDILSLVKVIIGENGEKNLISKILEDLPNLVEHLGIKDGVAQSGSVWELLVNKFFQPNHNSELPSPDLLKELLTAVARIYKKIDQPTDFKDDFVELFDNDNAFEFNFSNPVKFDDVAIKGQTLKTAYTDENGQVQNYTFKYERETKFAVFKLVEITKEV